MLDTPSLIQRIRDEFGTIPFPFHRGLHAAMAMDDWIADEATLREITRTKDFIGEWWEIPLAELRCSMLAHSYLDEHGIEFYLPAYMVAILEHPLAFDRPGCSSSWQLINLMSPDSDDPELREYFRERFVRIVGGKKRVCRDFLKFVSTSTLYNGHANELARDALAHAFWSVDS
ncbi:MAG: hypothetical protein MN733_26880 [Nitrososphaera sp.]|nr:hypothetical protein [Nitrososphaera sp.]